MDYVAFQRAALSSFDPSMPIHEQVRQALEGAILSGVLKPGERLPSEAELCEAHGASRTPVRQALRELENSGLIYRAQGRGSFIRERKIEGALRELSGLSEELRQDGHTVEPHILSVDEVPADADAASALSLPVGTPIGFVRRLHIVDGQPLALFYHRLPPMIPTATIRAAGDFMSMYELLDRSGFPPMEGDEEISAALLTDEEARLLDVPRPAAALMMRRVARTATGIPIEFTVYLTRSDRYQYRVSLTRRTR